MRDVIKLVRGAVSTKGLLPVLTHFAVHEGHVHGTNGRVHLCAPAPELAHLPSFTVPAARLLSAVDACVGEPVLHLTAGHCTVTDSGSRFRARLPVGSVQDFPLVAVPKASAKAWKRPGKGCALLPVLRVLRPFIGEDASRPWCPSISFRGAVAVATNNVILAALPLPKEWPLLPAFALPVAGVEELLRVGLEPTHAMVEEGAATFRLPGGAWLRCSLLAAEWPDAMAILHSLHEGAKLHKVPTTAKLAVEQVTPFCPNPAHMAVELSGERVSTETTGEVDAAVEDVTGLRGQGVYHAKPLLSVLEVATHADWSRYPRVPWRGADGLQGVLVGLRGA